MKTFTAEHGKGDSAEIHFWLVKQTSVLGNASACGAVPTQQLIEEADRQLLHFKTFLKIEAVLLFLCFLFCHCLNVIFTSWGLSIVLITSVHVLHRVPERNPGVKWDCNLACM